jgi:hypothetical protein
VPHARRDIDPPEAVTCRFSAKLVTGSDSSRFVEKNHVSRAFKNYKGFGLGRTGVTMRAYVGSGEQDIQKSMRIVIWARMEVMIHPATRRRCRSGFDGIE